MVRVLIYFGGSVNRICYTAWISSYSHQSLGLSNLNDGITMNRLMEDCQRVYSRIFVGQEVSCFVSHMLSLSGKQQVSTYNQNGLLFK